MLTLALFIGLLFVVLFSVFAEIIIRCPLLVSGIIVTLSLIAFALLFDSLGLTFIIWIIIYAIISLVTAFLTDIFGRRRRNGRNERNEDNNINNCF